MKEYKYRMTYLEGLKVKTTTLTSNVEIENKCQATKVLRQAIGDENVINVLKFIGV